MGTQPPTAARPTFGPCLLWPNGRPSQQLLSSCTKMAKCRMMQITWHDDTQTPVFWYQRAAPNNDTYYTQGRKNLQLLTNNSLYLEISTRQIHSFYKRQIGDRMHSIEWWHSHWPWVTPITPNYPYFYILQFCFSFISMERLKAESSNLYPGRPYWVLM